MSTIKSSNEHLTLNADGSSKDIKFQANGVEKASISSAGAFTSTTIDATKLTGNLPAISGAALTGVGVSGISSSADATAITIDSAENVGVGTTPKTTTATYTNLQVGGTGTVLGYKTQVSGSDFILGNNVYYNSGFKRMYNEQASMVEQLSGKINFKVSAAGSADSAITWTNALEITNDGRGLSQFTAKAWAKLNGTGTPSFYDSHNCSSITDNATGSYTVNFANNTANSNYAALGNAGTTGNPQGLRTVNVYSYGSGGVTFGISYVDGTGQDVPLINIAIFGD